MMKVNVRINLSHFLNKPFEKEVVDKLEEIHKDSIIYYLTLWYEDGKLTPGDCREKDMKIIKKLYSEAGFDIPDFQT